MNMYTFIKDFMKDESGATAIEYGLIAALVALALVGVLEMLRDSLIRLPMNQITSAIASVLS